MTKPIPKLAKLGLLVLVILGLWFVLRPVFSGQTILPQSFHLGPLNIHYYGVLIAAAVLGGYRLAMKRAEKYGLNSEQVDKLILIVAVVGFLGARAYHVITDLGYYRHNLIQVFYVWNGGLSIFGVVIGGVVGLAIAKQLWFKNYQFLKLLDWIAPSLVLGQIIGRFGNLFNYELFGYPTSLPWKMFVPENFRPAAFPQISFFHPLFFYEASLNLFILFFLLKIVKDDRSPGTLFFSYLFLYNAVRFFLEFLRIDSVFLGPLRFNSLISALLVVIALVGLKYNKHASTLTPNN